MQTRNVPFVLPRRPRVEMVPLIDMFFLLLVFFIFGVFSMTMQQGLLVDLPVAKTTSASQEPTVTISLTVDGGMFVDQEPVSVEQLAFQLQQVHAHRPATTVVINADRQVPHGVVMTVLDTVRETGLQRVSLQAASPAP